MDLAVVHAVQTIGQCTGTAMLAVGGSLDHMTEYAINTVEQYSYGGLFAVLVLCAFGLPISEDLPLIVAGYMIWLGVTRPWITLGVSMVGVLIGDIILFGFGRIWGEGLLRTFYFRQILTEKKLQWVRGLVRKHGWRAMVLLRFLPGLRAPGFFVAGSLSMPVLHFVIPDAAAAAVSVPVALGIGYIFGGRIDAAVQTLHEAHTWIALVAAILVVIGVAFEIWRRRRKAKAAFRDQVPPA